MMSKLKRPEKIQTSMNGATGGNSATSSPALSAKRPPSAQLPPSSATSNGAGTNGVGSRTANRPRRDVPTQLLGRGQRMSSAGLRSASIVPDTAIAQVSELRPYVQSDAYILRKYRGCLASLVVHLYPNHFKFDQQDGTFSYKSPMRIFIEHLRLGTVPHDLLDMFIASGVTFYEGCLIVEVHDHKSIAPVRSKSLAPSSVEKIEPFSLHNYNACLTPSPYVPFPKEESISLTQKESNNNGEEGSKSKTALEKDREDMPAPNQPLDLQRNRGGKKEAKISTVVLHPTPLGNFTDIAIKASTPIAVPTGTRRESRADAITPMLARPQTPLLAMPPALHAGMEPPAKRVKREKMELDVKNTHAFEAQFTFATNAPLFLDKVSSTADAAYLLEILTHPEHSAKLPSPKSRKKTVAEMAAEESATKNEQAFMLTLDELRHSSGNGAPGGTNPSDTDGQAGAASWEPRFESFRTIENIKLQALENKKKEKMQQAENAKRQQQESEQLRAKQQAENAKRVEEEARLRLQQQQQQQQQAQQAQVMKQQQLQREQQRRAQMLQQATLQGQPGMQGPNPQMNQPQMQQSHTAQQNGIMQNQMQQQQRLMQQQQFSQGQASSPIVRNATPHNLSSPMVATNMGVSMQQSTSSMGGSPPRPGSVVQQGNPQMTPAMTHAMRAQGSQHSHGGTPRPMNATPNIPQPGPRPMSQTPRMAMSPMPGMVQAPQMGAAQQQMMMQNAQMNNLQLQQAQLAQQQQQVAQQQRLRQQAAQMAMGSSPTGFQMTPQQQMLMQQQLQQQQSNPQMMSNNQMSQQYAAQMRSMAQAQQAAAAMTQGNNPNFMAANGMTPQRLQAMQIQAQQQQQQQQQQMAPAQIQAHQVRMMSTKLYQNGLQELSAQWGGQIPEQAMNQYKQKVMQQAQQIVQQQMRQRAAHAQQQQQQAMGHNVNMMQNMGRPSGM